MLAWNVQETKGDRLRKVDGGMEWDLKEFAWESAELEQKEDSDLSAMVEFSSNTTLEKQQKTVGSLGDLKLTMVDSTEDPISLSNSNEAARNSVSASSPSSGSSSKKLSNGTQKASCLVDGCKADLSNCREYHKRHRVCERHSKTPIVFVKGEEKRFCQQCSRFHSLGEFDEVKRSCRKRLDGHNRRRRKSQPESLFFTSKSFLSTYKGPKILHFGNPQIYAPTTVTSGLDPLVYGRHQRNRPPNSFNGGDTQLFFLQENEPVKGNQATTEPFLCDPFENTINGTPGKVPYDVSGGRALYLLSSNPTQIPGIGLNHLVPYSNDQTHSLQFLNSPGLRISGLSTEYSSSCSYDHVKDKPMDCNMILRMGPDGFLEHGVQQSFPISLD